MNSTADQILNQFKKIAVVGLSPDESRASFYVTQYMIKQGYEVVGVRPGGHQQILGRPVYENLLAVPKPLEIVNVFRNSKEVPAIVDQAIACGAQALWLQEGVSHPEAEKKAKNAGMLVVSDCCILKEHRRWSRT